jgi:hypothetical protein
MPVKRKKKATKKTAARSKVAPKKKAAKTNGAGVWTQKSIPRKEDGRLIRGQGKFVDDYKFPGMLHMVLHRSPYGHARINSVDTSEAEKAPGVVCVLTGEEIAKQVQPFLEIGPDPGAKIIDYPMAVGNARYQGEPVAAVVAETRMQAEDAAELIQVDYDVLPAVVDTEEAFTDKTILHESSGTNLVWRGQFDYGNVDKAFKQAAHIVRIDRLHFHRFSSTPLENNAVVAQWDPGDDRIDFWGRHRWQLRHQDHQLHLHGHRRPGVKESRWPARQVDRNPIRAHDGQRPWQRARLSRYASSPRQERCHHRHRLPPHRRLRRLPALRAPRLHHLGPGSAGGLPLPQLSSRFQPGGE